MADNFYKDVQEMINLALAETNLFATVDSVSGTNVYVKFPGSEIVHGPFAAGIGVAAFLIAGDVVKVERVRGQYIVAYALTGTGFIPTNIIAIWTGTLATIPSGWALCDGTNGTPNLVDKFIKGVATSATEPGTTGGATTHTHTGHSDHVVTQPTAHNLTSNTPSATVTVVTVGGTITVGTNSHTHGVTGSHTGTAVDAHSAHNSPDHRPPYYEVAFIMKL